MKVFMLGWEFPPHISGGLGTACLGMTRALDTLGTEVSFVLPASVPVDSGEHVRLRSPSDLIASEDASAPGVPERPEGLSEHVRLHQLEAVLQPYGQAQTYSQAVSEWIVAAERAASAAPAERARQILDSLPTVEAVRSALPATFPAGAGENYAGDLMAQVHRYARLAVELARRERFDVIHAHDWMTYPAAVAVASATGRPLVVHVHSTEFDRSGENINQQVYDIERMGMHCAARVVCVSHYTRRICLYRYGVDEEKVEVVYNAVDLPAGGDWSMPPIRQNEKLVLFLGRVTMQKGPEYFLQAARKVVDRFPDVRFVMAGSGDMMTRCVRMVADLRLGRHVTFTGFLRGYDVDRVFKMADLFVMPSVSEPFGIAPLEALSHNVPVIISKQSGVSEVLTHALKVDFWDIDEMANKILAVLRHPPLQSTLRQHGQIELRKMSWQDNARKLQRIYRELAPSA
jgi:glycosyltransferase involved in cell wall biosynthesis